ncbi:MAG: hypothetical protein Phyf2KO_13970 [Phycisphaerales bacterium]
MTTSQIVFVTISLLILVVVTVYLLRRRGTGGYNIGSYSEIRTDIIDQLEGSEPPKILTERPVGIDKRLSADAGQNFEKQYEIHTQNPQAQNSLFELYIDVVRSIMDELAELSPEYDALDLLSEPRRVIHVVDSLVADVNNGGFDQYFLNSSGNGAAMAPEGFRSIGMPEIAAVIEKANAVFGETPSMLRHKRVGQLDKLSDESRETWNECDDQYFALEADQLTASAQFIIQNKVEFFRD